MQIGQDSYTGKYPQKRLVLVPDTRRVLVFLKHWPFLVIILVIELRPHVLVAGVLMPLVIRYPEIPEEILLRVHGIPRVIPAAPHVWTFEAITAPVARTVFSTSYHPSSPPYCSSTGK